MNLLEINGRQDYLRIGLNPTSEWKLRSNGRVATLGRAKQASREFNTTASVSESATWVIFIGVSGVIDRGAMRHRKVAVSLA